MALVISLGGSTINGKGKPDLGFVRRFAGSVSALKGKVGVVTGGGKIARDYAAALSSLGGRVFAADSVAVRATRMNAQLVQEALGEEAYPGIPEEFEEAAAALGNYRFVVMGGTIPGITTDTDSVLLAEAIGAKRLVNISNVRGIYDSDPRKNRKAKMFKKMKHRELVELAEEADKRKPGTHFIFDLVACRLAMRSGLELHFVGAKNLGELAKAASGKPHGGTVVSLK
jgi:uridylate kinase